MLAANRKYRNEIDVLRRERATLYTVHKTMETKLNTADKDAKEQASKAQFREKKTGFLIFNTIINNFTLKGKLNNKYMI